MSSLIKLEEEHLLSLKKELKTGQCEDMDVAYKTFVRACKITDERVEAKLFKKGTKEDRLVATYVYEVGKGFSKE